ncbi:MAG TPA: bifunctional metallophosphatase/5'-nucleotidase [Actinomycetota bacterium]|nr:bifunctional metallophosphatase/5'-nucleotidase [Actinomycetota bacterium]
MRRTWLRSWAGHLLVTAVAVGVVVAAPLAARDQAATDTVTISGARSLSDQVSVSYSKPDRRRSTDVHLLAFNDLHGNLEAGGNNLYGRFAGGAAYLAKAIKDRQAKYGKGQATIFAGDNIGASPLANGLFFEEPITIATNLMHAEFGSVGNHEFDKGSAELLRIQNGGCKPVDGCTAAPYALANGGTTNVYPGADFQYLSANVVVDATGRTLFPAFGTKTFKGDSGRKFQVGFIGEVLEATPTIVTPTGVAGLSFQDEADAANRTVKQLQARGVKTSVLVVHEGGFQQAPAALNGCAGNLAGSAIADIASRLDQAIKVIVSAHTHAEYRCTITSGGVTRLITSASSFGRVLSDVTLTINDKSGELEQASAENVLVENALNTPGPGVTRIPDPSKEDPQVQKVVDQYVAAAAPLANRVIGRIQGDLTRTGSPQGETTLGDVIADAQLAATQPANLGGAQLAFMNPGGIRADLRVGDISSGGEAPGEVTYGEAFTVQPFGNSLVTKTMTGDMIRRLLEQQFVGCAVPTTNRILQVSNTFRYEQNAAASTCADRIGRMFVGGVEVTPTASFRVTMNNFLAAGGDGFTVFNEGTDALGGAQDIDAFVAAFAAAEPAGIAVPPLDRIVAPATP